MSDQTDSSDVAQFLSNHPRMIGTLFALMLLLGSATTAAAVGPGSTPVGP
jgi:hypothetical protein